MTEYLPCYLDRSGGFNVSCRLYIRTGNEGGVTVHLHGRPALMGAVHRSAIGHKCGSRLNGQGILVHVTKIFMSTQSTDGRGLHLNGTNNARSISLGMKIKVRG